MSGSHKRTLARTAIIAAVSLVAVSSAKADGIAWQTDMQAAAKQAQVTGKPMLIQFTASWCHYCRKMKATTYADSKVSAYVTANFVPVMLDADKHGEIVKKLRLRGLPATVIVAPDLVILGKLNGYQNATKLTTELGKALKMRQKVAAVAYAKPAGAPVAAKTSQKQAGPPRTVAPSRKPAATARVQPVKQTREVPIAFGGLSLVSLRESRELKSGTSEFRTTHDGYALYFANSVELQKFNKAPERYWPKYSGQCVVSAAEGRRVVGNPEFGVLYRDAVWMFETAEKMSRFVKNPDQFVK